MSKSVPKFPPNRPCCQSGCLSCPYDYLSKVNPYIPAELTSPVSVDIEELEDESE